jgi:hypothetical protein
MKHDYRKTKAGQRVSFDSETYRKSLEFQKYLKSKGIAWHNVFANECTIDFCCCVGDGKYTAHFPSYYSSAKQLFDELFEKIKHGDTAHQQWLKNEMDSFLKNELLHNEP